MDQLQELNTSMSNVRNRLRDLEHEVHRIEERRNVSVYVDTNGPTFPISIGNSVFMVNKEMIKPILEECDRYDTLFLNDLQKRLTKVLEEL